MQTESLGAHKKDFKFVALGVVPAGEMAALALEIVTLAGMTPARRRRISRYPYPGRGGKGWALWLLWLITGSKWGWGGGQGYTLFQDLMESYLVADVYTDIGQTEITLSTCKPERVQEWEIIAYLSVNLGPVISPMERTVP